MKKTRLGALATALAMTFSLTTIPASAADFTDVKKPIPGVQEGHWAYEYITKMSNLGLAGGYPDGSFKPNGQMTAAECLLFCARATQIDGGTQARIEADHGAQVKDVLPSDIATWKTAPRELAVAIETGVLSLAELEALSDAGALGRKITRENICLYLVRAMQLEPLAKSLSTYILPFNDRDDIAPTLRPYVYVLNNFGIVNGVEGNLFDPHGKVTRAQMTTMLSRAVDFIESSGISVELSEYTDYQWTGGVIETVSPSTGGSLMLGLTNELSGRASYSLASGVKVYKDNMLTTFSDLKPGQYIRLNMSPSGAVREVRLGGPLTTYTGSITKLSPDGISIMVNGTNKTYEIDRFTQLAAGSTPVSRELLQPDAGYTAASCFVDSMGHLAGVKLSGGTRLVTGLVKSVETEKGVTTLNLSAPNGVIYPYQLASGAIITANGVPAELSTKAHKGCYVQLRVDSDSGKAAAVMVDTKATYLQGPILDINPVGNDVSVNIDSAITGSDTYYVVDNNASITYNGTAIKPGQLEEGWYATALVENKLITRLEAFPGEESVKGLLTSISYGPTTVLEVTREDGTKADFRLDVDELPTIKRNGSYSTVDQLRPGDNVTVSVKYNKVTLIEAEPQSANLTGTISSITLKLGGADIKVELEDGTVRTFYAPDGITVTQDKTYTNLYALKPGHQVGLVTNGDTLVSVAITGAASSSTQISGKIYTTNASNSTLTLLTERDSSPITVNLSGASLMRLDGSTGLKLSSFHSDDPVTCYGSYSGSVFNATIVILQK